MRHILVEIVCRNCNYHSHIKSHTLVNSQLEPELKERIVQGTMFRYQCPCCHTVIAFIHSFLYHDNEQKLLIGMDLKEQTITAFAQVTLSCGLEKERNLLKFFSVSGNL